MDTLKGPIDTTSCSLTGAEPPVCSGLPHKIELLTRALAAEFELVMGSSERVKMLCGRLEEELLGCSQTARDECLAQLLSLLHRQRGDRVSPVFALLERAVSASREPWILLRGMLVARDRDLAVRALELAASMVAAGSLLVGREAALFFAEQVEIEETPLARPDSLSKIACILNRRSISDASLTGPIEELLLKETDGKLRRLAARLLDLGGHPPSRSVAMELLGGESYEFLRPYLEYTRATHLDLLHIGPEGAALVLPALHKAQKICGEAVLREVIAELGWTRVNLGLEVREYAGLSFSGSFPLVVRPSEAPILESCGEARRTFELFLFTAHGGEQVETPRRGSASDLVARFRAYNLAHAEALADILDLAPLTRDKANRILWRMDRIVEDFSALFESHSDEIALIPGVYGDLRQKIVQELERENHHPQLSADLTRLVLMFEDPPSLGHVRTLHGLKRYLHQKGLRLGIRLVQGGRSTNRTISLAVASRKRILRAAIPISYVDFEPEREADQTTAAVSYPVAALADALGRQMLCGQETFPSTRVFCYGNEVHYYLSYRNHPALLRIDFSPPLQGGMIDLEYYGVSKYELSQHPDPSLSAAQLFFRRLEFDVRVENTHIHARYDKERAPDLEDLCRKAEALFALIPYLMELDWIIGGLSLDSEARRKVAEIWAERFALWRILPVSQLLTKDRQWILAGLESGPPGEMELKWSGEGPYLDRFASTLPGDVLNRLRSAVDVLGLDLETLGEGKECQILGQVRMERCLLDPIRAAVACGELMECPEGLRRSPALLFQREHEVERMAAVLEAADDVLESAANVARLITPLERFLRFQTTGYVDGYEVQRTRLPLL